MDLDKASLIDFLAQEETKLAQLDSERKSILDRIVKLRQQLSVTDSVHSTAQKPSELSPKAKIDLFRSLFKGRGDVYPKLWISKSGDRKGYMPACANDGNYSLRGKRKFPRVKCGDCNQKLISKTRDVCYSGYAIIVHPSVRCENCGAEVMPHETFVCRLEYKYGPPTERMLEYHAELFCLIDLFRLYAVRLRKH